MATRVMLRRTLCQSKFANTKYNDRVCENLVRSMTFVKALAQSAFS